MWLLWLTFILMILVALAFIIIPLSKGLARGTNDHQIAHKQAIKKLYQTQLDEIERQKEEGTLPLAQYKIEKEDILRNLLSDLSLHKTRIKTRSPHKAIDIF